jgi:hypothetical protein
MKALKALLLLAFCSLFASCTRQRAPAPLDAAPLARIEIVGGRSMGGVVLGSDVGALPSGASVAGSSGQLGAVRFAIEGGKVSNIWLDDLRALPEGTAADGVVLSPLATLDEIKRLLGPCEPAEPVKGGVFFRCARGLLVGTDFDEKGTFVQLRLR